MTKKTKLGLWTVAIAATTALAGVAHAGVGRAGDGEVTVETSGTWWRARGIPRVVHQSNDTVQYIGCSASAMAGTTLVACRATDARGVSYACSTGDPVAREIVAGMQPDDYVEFQPWLPIFGHSPSECHTIIVSHASAWLPIAPGTVAASPALDPSPGAMRAGY